MNEGWRQLAEFQLSLSIRWRTRAAVTTDSFARFFFHFTGFNALYYAWSKIDAQRGRDADGSAREDKQIVHLLSKMPEDEAAALLARCAESISIFHARSIERMDKRTQEKFSTGDANEGEAARAQLNSGVVSEQLAGLGKILYLIRCNLVHGAKMDAGDDEVIVESALQPLSLLCDWSIAYTTQQLQGQ